MLLLRHGLQYPAIFKRNLNNCNFMRNGTIKFCVIGIFSLLLFAGSKQLAAQGPKTPGKLAPTPPMGWNSWNFFGKEDINETVVRDVIDAMVEKGLKDAGYEYVIIDGGWRDVKLGANGELLPHPVKFPNGIKPLADYAHSKGLKFGLHTVPGTHDCGGDAVGGLGHEEVHVRQFAEWGLDFIKLDKCRNSEGWEEDEVKAVYYKWHDLLSTCGRDIVLSISAYKYRDWYPEACEMARTTTDIAAESNGGARFDSGDTPRSFWSVMRVAWKNNEYATFAKHGYWNDPDMLVTGNRGLTVEEQKAHFALWCIMSSPLFLGNNPINMSEDERDIITNKLAIRVNQDATEQGTQLKTDGKTEVWAKHLNDGKVAVLLLNREQEKTTIEISLEELGLQGKVKMKDIYSGADLGRASKKVARKVPARSGRFLMLSPL